MPCDLILTISSRISLIKWCVDHIYCFYGSIYVTFTKIGQKSISSTSAPQQNRYNFSTRSLSAGWHGWRYLPKEPPEYWFIRVSCGVDFDLNMFLIFSVLQHLPSVCHCNFELREAQFPTWVKSTGCDWSPTMIISQAGPGCLPKSAEVHCNIEDTVVGLLWR